MNGGFLGCRSAAVDSGVGCDSFPGDVYALVVVILRNEPAGPRIRAFLTHGPLDVIAGRVLIHAGEVVTTVEILGVDVWLLFAEQFVEGLGLRLLASRP